MVSFLHLLEAIDNYFTPYKFGFRKPKRWGPRGEKVISSTIRTDAEIGFIIRDPKISVFDIQIYVACISCQ